MWEKIFMLGYDEEPQYKENYGNLVGYTVKARLVLCAWVHTVSLAPDYRVLQGNNVFSV